MIQNYSIWKVLRVFFNDPVPQEGFTIRYISRHTGLTYPSVKLHLDRLCRQTERGYPLVIRSNGISFPVYRPNRESELFRFLKKMDMIFRIEESGLIGFISEKLSPDSIVLFGSASRGEDVKESDVDLFIQSEEASLDVSKFEAILNRCISLHFSKDLNRLPKELRNNIINGIILGGYLKVF